MEPDKIGITFGRIALEAENELCSKIGELLGIATQLVDSMKEQPKDNTKSALIINLLTGALIYASWKIIAPENRKDFIVLMSKQIWYNYEQYDEVNLK